MNVFLKYIRDIINFNPKTNNHTPTFVEDLRPIQKYEATHRRCVDFIYHFKVSLLYFEAIAPNLGAVAFYF